MSSLSIASSSSSNTSSIYSDRTVISGLASGLDTESLIEEAVSGYQTKITDLEAQVTKYEWKQEAYRDIITPMVSFQSTYLDSTSSTSLCSNTFFNNATKVTSNGTYADLISATGRTSSEISITQVKQLATAARYNGIGSTLSANVTSGKNAVGSDIDLNETTYTSKLSGTMTVGYGGQYVYLNFSEDDIYDSADALAKAINDKLAAKSISFDGGDSKTASECIEAVVNTDGSISLKEIGSAGNGAWISDASSAIKSALNLDLSGDDKVSTFSFNAATAKVESTDKLTSLSGKSLSITLDGTTKSVKGPTQEEVDAAAGSTDEEKYIAALQKKIDTAFGFDDSNRKLEVANGSTTNGKLALKFSVTNNTSTFQITGSSFGISGTLSNYVDTSNTLGELMDLEATATDGTSLYTTKKNDDGTDATDTDGNKIYTLQINGQTFEVTKDTTISSLMSSINSNDDVGVSVTYSKTTKQFSLTAKETGTSGKVSFDDDLAKAIFGEVREDTVDADGNVTAKGNYTAGKNAIFSATVNGVEIEDMERDSNSVEIDGLTLKLKGEFTAEKTSDAVTFTVTSDADKIVDAIKSMITDYNSIVKSVKSAYTTMPAQKSDGSSYEPLSDDDMADMSESAIEKYNTKAKQGLLFMDSDLSSLYESLRDCFSSTTLSSIGISTSYSDGLTTVTLDETKLRQALEDDPDKVRDLFTSSTSSGASYNGVAQKLKTVFNTYVKTYGATKGRLIEKSGASEASASLTSNTWYTAIQSLEEQIEKWQDKLSDKVDYYTTKFTNLETLISEMNSQSSMLSSLSGG